MGEWAQLNSIQVYNYLLSTDYVPRNFLDADNTKNLFESLEQDHGPMKSQKLIKI